jgi:predicted enzyme related to lactoylglutathione lyase
MGDYSDFVMNGAAGPVAGVCHARGGNAGIPSQWMIYITVENLDRAMGACRAGGGEVINGPRQAGEHGRFCIIRDPGGAVAGLFENA